MASKTAEKPKSAIELAYTAAREQLPQKPRMFELKTNEETGRLVLPLFVFVRGLPGSQKRAHGMALEKQFRDAGFTDTLYFGGTDYFYSTNTLHELRTDRLPNTTQYAFGRILELMARKCQVIIFNSPSLRVAHMRLFMRLALANNYNYIQSIPENPWMFNEKGAWNIPELMAHDSKKMTEAVMQMCVERWEWNFEMMFLDPESLVEKIKQRREAVDLPHATGASQAAK